MRTETKEYTLYKYEELSDKAKVKALQHFYDLNVDYEWWEFCFEDFHEKLKEVGLACKTFYFGLDRDRHIEAKNLHFIDVNKFIETSIQSNVKKSILNIADLHLQTHTNRHEWYTIDTYNGIPDRCPRLNKFIDSLLDRCNDKLHDIFEGFCIQLQKEYEYLTSEEAIVETIEANDYEFLENGELFKG